MPDLIIYAFLGFVALVVLLVVFLVVLRGFRPKRGPSSFNSTGIDGDMGI